MKKEPRNKSGATQKQLRARSRASAAALILCVLMLAAMIVFQKSSISSLEKKLHPLMDEAMSAVYAEELETAARAGREIDAILREHEGAMMIYASHRDIVELQRCSGELAALRLLGAFARAKASGKTISESLAPITRKYANSGEMNFTVDGKPAAIARVLEAAKELGAETGRSDIDGYRIEYAEGWVSVRQSNTEPLLRLLVECDTPARLASWRATLVAALQS